MSKILAVLIAVGLLGGLVLSRKSEKAKSEPIKKEEIKKEEKKSEAPKLIGGGGKELK